MYYKIIDNIGIRMFMLERTQNGFRLEHIIESSFRNSKCTGYWPVINVSVLAYEILEKKILFKTIMKFF